MTTYTNGRPTWASLAKLLAAVVLTATVLLGMWRIHEASCAEMRMMNRNRQAEIHSLRVTTARHDECIDHIQAALAEIARDMKELLKRSKP